MSDHWAPGWTHRPEQTPEARDAARLADIQRAEQADRREERRQAGKAAAARIDARSLADSARACADPVRRGELIVAARDKAAEAAHHGPSTPPYDPTIAAAAIARRRATRAGSTAGSTAPNPQGGQSRRHQAVVAQNLQSIQRLIEERTGRKPRRYAAS